MANSLKLPVGIENFEEIRKFGFYYMDKTKLIEQLVETGGKVTLFTRPRRFGKTLNMSMLRAFLRQARIRHCLTGYILRETRKFANNIWENTRSYFFHSRAWKDYLMRMQGIVSQSWQEERHNVFHFCQRVTNYLIMKRSSIRQLSHCIMVNILWMRIY